MLKLILSWMVPLLLSHAHAGAGPGVGQGPAPQPRLIVPAYFYPHEQGLASWDRLLESASRAEIVAIINPANGPGERPDPNYLAIFERAAKTRMIPIGYVTTSYARRPLDEVKSDIDRWVRLYPDIRGIFFDEQTSGAEYVDYQAALYEYAKREHGLGLIVTNPGTICSEDYLARPAADVVCLFEGPMAPGRLDMPGWIDRYDPSRIYALPYEVETGEQMRACVRKAAGEGIGALYVTDAGGKMPWGRLPRYWEEEVASVMDVSGPRPGEEPGE